MFKYICVYTEYLIINPYSMDDINGLYNV